MISIRASDTDGHFTQTVNHTTDAPVQDVVPSIPIMNYGWNFLGTALTALLQHTLPAVARSRLRAASCVMPTFSSNLLGESDVILVRRGKHGPLPNNGGQASRENNKTRGMHKLWAELFIEQRSWTLMT